MRTDQVNPRPDSAAALRSAGAAGPGLRGPCPLLVLTCAQDWPRRLQSELAYSRRPEAVQPVQDLAALEHGLRAAGGAAAAIVDLTNHRPATEALLGQLAASSLGAAVRPGRDGPTWLVMGRREDASALAQALRLGARGVVPTDGKPAEWLAALDAARRGDLPIHPALAGAVLQRLLVSAATGWHRTMPQPAGQASPTEAALDEPVSPALSAREARVLSLAAQGLGYPAMAEALALSRHTVITYARRAMRKLDARSLPHAVGRAAHAGVLPVAPGPSGR